MRRRRCEERELGILAAARSSRGEGVEDFGVYMTARGNGGDKDDPKQKKFGNNLARLCCSLIAGSSRETTRPQKSSIPLH